MNRRVPRRHVHGYCARAVVAKAVTGQRLAKEAETLGALQHAFWVCAVRVGIVA